MGLQRRLQSYIVLQLPAQFVRFCHGHSLYTAEITKPWGMGYGVWGDSAWVQAFKECSQSYYVVHSSSSKQVRSSVSKSEQNPVGSGAVRCSVVQCGVVLLTVAIRGVLVQVLSALALCGLIPCDTAVARRHRTAHLMQHQLGRDLVSTHNRSSPTCAHAESGIPRFLCLQSRKKCARIAK